MSDQDDEMRALYSSLSPSEHQTARMLEKIRQKRDEANLPTLTEEWITLLRVRPIVHTAMTFSAAAALLLGLPMAGIMHALYTLFYR